MKPKYNRIILPVVFSLFVVQAIVPQINSLTDATLIVNALNGGTDSAANNRAADLMLQLAMSSPDYHVTAGDVYTLAYAAGTTAVTYVITVDSTYRIRVSNLGIVDAAGKTYTQLKTQVEAVVSNNYPLSGAQLILTKPAAFRVYIKGEVKAAAEKNAWGLSRLSEILDGNLTDFSSRRDIAVRSVNGQEKVYDVYQAVRQGDLSQNPYLRPGDVITVNRAARTVTIEGAVERPGTYQLKDGEHLKELIEFYGSGFTVTADRTRLEMVRVVNSAALSGDKIFLSEADVEGYYELADRDVIAVPELTNLRPVIFVEGAIGTEAGASPTVSTREVVPFNLGENYASLVRRNKAWFSAVSDTQNAYIIRGDEHIPINLNPILFDAMYHNEFEIKENDTLIIPFRQYFITVAGAVMAPGRYPYIPDREWDYYIALAGGFRPGQNAFQSISITDITGKKMRKGDIITPETIITARTNDGLYYFNQYAPVITTTMTIIMTFLTLWTTLGK
jgi:protein involved in polysaccharide export with SLBB domain